MTEIYIAGASSRARTTKEYFETLHSDIKVRAFLVSPEMDDNPDEADGIPIIVINSNEGIDTSSKVYLGTRGVNHAKLAEELLGIGFLQDNIIPVTPALDMELRNEYVRKVFEIEGKNFEKINEKDVCDKTTSESYDVKIYVAKTLFDSEFSKPVVLKEHEKIIQAGTEIADGKLTDALFFDNDGENISNLNRQFCELTAFYWIWKHSGADIIGLEHWRRRFLLPDSWMQIIEEKGSDVVLPVPLCVMPSLEGNFKDRHMPEIWDAVMVILGEMYPEDIENAKKYFGAEKLYSPCNMIIAKRQILTDYCEWLFPVLFELNRRMGTIEDNYQNRYPGFVSERLLNFYFNVRRKDLKIIYADKSFLS